MTETHETYYSDEALILDWIFYLDVMYRFSVKMWTDPTPSQIQLAGQESIISKAIFSPERQFVGHTP